MGRYTNNWTPDLDAVLIETVATGRTREEAAALVDRSVNSVYCRIKALRDLGVIPRANAHEAETHRAVVHFGVRKGYTKRPCMCCQVEFWSEGNHNRLCASCRSTPVSPYAI